MTSRSHIQVRIVLQILAVLFAALATGMLIPVADADSHLSLLIGGFLAATIVALLFLIPIRFLPGLTLLVTLLIPTEVTLFPHELQGAALGIVPLAVWMIRAPRSTQTPTSLRILASLFGMWLILSATFAPLHTHHGLEWLITVGAAIVFSVTSAPMGANVRDFRALFLNVTTILGIYALFEGFVLHHNLLFGGLLQHTIWWAAERNNASYRVTTLLGHPLVNGLVFSAAAVLAASELVQKSSRTRNSFVRFVILVGATDATHSRGATLALGIGVIVVIIFSRGSGRGMSTRRLILAISILLGGVFLLYGLKARDESHQGKASAQVRVTVISRTLEAVNDLGPLGAGPGESEAYRRVERLPGWEVDLENSYAQLAVSLGPIGALLMAILLIAVVAFGLKNELVTGEAAALLAILIDIGTFNTIEGHTNVGILIALFVIVIVTAPRPVTNATRRSLRTGSRSVARESIAIGS